jgi:hypothetical protein
MPPNSVIPSMVWPGSDGEPAWAVPIQIPSGTRGYALFVPMVPVQPVAPSPTAADQAGGAQTAPAAEVAAAAGAGPALTAGHPGHAATAATIVKPGATAGTSGASDVAAAKPGASDAAAAKPGASDAAAARASESDVAAAGATSIDSGAAGAKQAAGAEPKSVSVDADATARRERTVTTGASAEAAPRQLPPRVAPPPPAPIGWHRPVHEPQPTWWQTFRERHWRGPAAAQGRAVPAAVLAGALGFVFFLPLGRTGIGWFLGWLVLTLGVVVAVRRSAKLSRSERWIRSGWAAAALALLAVLAFRNAWWLVTFSVLGALGCAALAIVGGRRIRSILFSLVAAPYAAFRGLPWVRRHLRASRNPGMARRVFFSAGLTVVVLFVFGALLSSADVAFSALLDRAVPDFDGGSIFEWIFLAVVGGLIAVAGTYTLSAPPAVSSMDTDGRGRFGLVEWAPACFALVLLFGGFVAVQFTVLFGGSRHVLKTSGLSYAEYARSGFWQLVAVTLLSLALLAALARWARRDQPVERLLLRVLLGLLCVLSVVIVTSALSRMWAYQRVYSFTGERIFVMSVEMLLGVIFVLIAVAGIRWQGRWIPSATVGLAVLMLLGLAVLDPEGYAASRNAVRYEKTGKIDAWYLRALSADATPALTRLPDPVRRCTLSWIADDLEKPDPWYAWNLGRVRARAAIDRLGKGAVGNHADCREADQYDLPKKRR